jgi:hypothetical protein
MTETHMKRALLTTAAFVLGTALATTSYAQGRHDEKPHGSTKPAVSVPSAAPVTGGRHDEGPYAHSPRKGAAKTTAEADASTTPDAGKSSK